MRSFKNEIVFFLCAGFSAMGTDFLSYLLLHQFLPYAVSKTLSFLLGSIVAYLMNKFFTFQQKEKSTTEIFRFMILYSLSLLANVLVNQTGIYLLKNEFSSFVLIAFLMATSVSTVMNFFGQKFWVFSVNKQRI